MKLKFLLFAISLVISFQSTAQQTIKGTITDDETKETLIGVIVSLKGKHRKIGTITDTDGNFKLNIPENTKAIHISYPHFYSQKIKIENDKSIYNIVLKFKESHSKDAGFYATQRKPFLKGVFKRKKRKKN